MLSQRGSLIATRPSAVFSRSKPTAVASARPDKSCLSLGRVMSCDGSSDYTPAMHRASVTNLTCVLRRIMRVRSSVRSLLARDLPVSMTAARPPASTRAEAQQGPLSMRLGEEV